MVVEAFGLDTRTDCCQGKRPIGFYPVCPYAFEDMLADEFWPD